MNKKIMVLILSCATCIPLFASPAPSEVSLKSLLLEPHTYTLSGTVEYANEKSAETSSVVSQFKAVEKNGLFEVKKIIKEYERRSGEMVYLGERMNISIYSDKLVLLSFADYTKKKGTPTYVMQRNCSSSAYVRKSSSGDIDFSFPSNYNKFVFYSCGDELIVSTTYNLSPGKDGNFIFTTLTVSQQDKIVGTNQFFYLLDSKGNFISSKKEFSIVSGKEMILDKALFFNKKGFGDTQ